MAHPQGSFVECFFSKLKQYIAVSARYEKLASNFLAFVKLAAARIWMCFMSRRPRRPVSLVKTWKLIIVSARKPILATPIPASSQVTRKARSTACSLGLLAAVNPRRSLITVVTVQCALSWKLRGPHSFVEVGKTEAKRLGRLHRGERAVAMHSSKTNRQVKRGALRVLFRHFTLVQRAAKRSLAFPL